MTYNSTIDIKQVVKTVTTAIHSAQKVKLQDIDWIFMPQQQFDAMVSLAETMMDMGSVIQGLEAKIQRIESANAQRTSSITRSNDPDDLLTQDQVAKQWGLSAKALEKWRVEGKEPKYIKLGNGKKSVVRYRRQDIMNFVSNHTYCSTTDFSSKKSAQKEV
ncbi:MAG: hypothetical protein SFX19_06960 [Alphaproteobacteria bacterium]|nr:hypothetical protein [Alphaproteobacteria bacterium]